MIAWPMGESCPQPETIDAFLAGRLDEAAVARVEAHVDVCPSCRILVGQLAKDSTYDRKRISIATGDTMHADDPATSDTMMPSASVATSETVRDRPAGTDDTAAGPQRKSRPSIRPIRIGRYLVERKLGAGGMGIVFLADDPELKRKVVIKLLRPELVEVTLQDRARLLREAQAMAKVSHQNVVPIFDVGLHDEQVFLAMEFIDGQDLAAWLAEQRTVKEVLDVFFAAGRGLAAAHRAGLVHRDFKPHNVMLAKTGEVKVTDFGLARAELEDAPAPVADRKHRPRVVPRDGDLGAATLLDSPITHTGVMVGTPAYMAPEQILAETVDARTDQFSFCVALYEALYRERPFRGQTTAELFDSTLDGKLPDVIASGRRVPAHVRNAIRRGLSVEPDARFPSMDALLAALAPRSRRNLAIGGAVLVAALGSAAAVVAFGGRSDDRALCTGGVSELARVWNPQRQATIERGFLAADKTAGPATSRAVVAAIDRYALGWQGGHREACEATRVRGEQTELVMDRRMHCLRQRREELDALLEILAKPDGALVNDASSIVSRLPSSTLCSNVDALATTKPTDPKVRDDVERLETELAKARALSAASRLDPANVQLVQILEQAEKAGHTPFVAEVQLELGLLAETQLDWPNAHKRLDRAVELAEQSSADQIRAQGYANLVSIAVAEGKLDDADRWARQARATIGRLGNDRQMLADLDRRVAEIHRTRGDEKQAEATYRRAIEELTAVHGANSREVAGAHEELAAMYASNRDHAHAFDEYKVARDGYLAALGPNNVEAATAIGNMGMSRYHLGQFEEALALGEQEVAMMRAYYGEDHPMLAGTYQLHALRLQGVGKNDEAIAMIKRAIAINEAAHANGEQRVVALQMLAMLYSNVKRNDLAYETFAKVLDAYIAMDGEVHVDVVVTINALGTVRRKQGRYDEALAMYERARTTIAKFQKPDSALMGDTLTRIGMTQLARKKPADAVRVLEEALAARIAGKASPESSSWTKLELAKALWEHGDRKRAVTLARESATEAEAAGDQGQLDESKQWLAAHAS